MQSRYSKIGLFIADWLRNSLTKLIDLSNTMETRMQMNIKKYAVPAIFLALLVITNPDKSELQKQLVSVPKSHWWTSLTRMFDTSIRSALGENMFYNFGIMSLVKAGANAYHVGIGGIWIESAFWVSIPGWFLMMQFVWHLITSAQIMYYCWMEFVVSSLWFVLLARRVDTMFRIEKYASTFFLVGSLLTVAIANLIFYPAKLFDKNRTHPGSLLYGVSSACLVYLTMTQQDAFRGGYLKWNGYDVDLSQLCLLVVVAQLLLGHSLGFAGSAAGVVLYYLTVFEILNEKHWY